MKEQIKTQTRTESKSGEVKKSESEKKRQMRISPWGGSPMKSTKETERSEK